MRLLAAFLITAAVVPAADTIEAFGYEWSIPIAADWRMEKDESGQPALRMLVARPQTQPRRPSQFALAQTADWKKVTVEAEAKRLGGSMIIVYAYKDPAHFNYVHFSVDTAEKQPVHNGVFHVFGGDRVRISPVTGPASFGDDKEEWYRLRVDYDSTTGEVVATVNGRKNSALRAADLSLAEGKVGIGSFFETAVFRNVRITGTPK